MFALKTAPSDLIIPKLIWAAVWAVVLWVINGLLIHNLDKYGNSPFNIRKFQRIG